PVRDDQRPTRGARRRLELGAGEGGILQLRVQPARPHVPGSALAQAAQCPSHDPCDESPARRGLVDQLRSGLGACGKAGHWMSEQAPRSGSPGPKEVLGAAQGEVPMPLDHLLPPSPGTQETSPEPAVSTPAAPAAATSSPSAAGPGLEQNGKRFGAILAPL